MVVFKLDKNVINTSSNSVIKYWRDNPVIAANHLLLRDGEPLELPPVQAAVLHEWWHSKFNLWTASRGLGKSFTGAVYLSLQAILYPGTKLGVFAPTFRQANFIFKEFSKLYQESPLLQQCVDKEPVKQNDQSICVFKSIGRGQAPSEIKALPVGVGGEKIRGERFRKVILDEIAQIPEIIFRSSIQPMMSTVVNPMQNVKKLKQMREIYGDQIPDDFNLSDNGYIGITSGYYQFNHLWHEILGFWDQIQQGSTKYSLRFSPYYEVPEGFYDSDVVEDARLNAPRHIFMTEWMAEWIADSEGAFPMSLLESCRDEKVRPKYKRDPDQDKGKNFIFGIDVARERDSTAIVIIELGHPSKTIGIFEYEEMPFPKQAENILKLVDAFHPIMIYMDEFGGGGTLRDHLADPASVGWGSDHKIITVEEGVHVSGKRILTLCNFNPTFIEDANNNTKTLLEQGAIRFPDSTHPIEGIRKGNSKSHNKEVDLVQELINQVASVVVTKTPTGKLHYDLPKGSNSVSKVKKKDLYSAFILACKCVYDLEWKPKAESRLLQHGVIKEFKSQATDLTGSLGSDSMTRRVGSSIIHPGNNKIVIPRGGIIVGRNGKKKR